VDAQVLSALEAFPERYPQFDEKVVQLLMVLRVSGPEAEVVDFLVGWHV